MYSTYILHYIYALIDGLIERGRQCSVDEKGLSCVLSVHVQYLYFAFQFGSQGFLCSKVWTVQNNCTIGAILSVSLRFYVNASMYIYNTYTHTLHIQYKLTHMYTYIHTYTGWNKYGILQEAATAAGRLPFDSRRNVLVSTSKTPIAAIMYMEVYRQLVCMYVRM